MLHEVADPGALLRIVRDRLTDDAPLLLVEPVGHVSGDRFRREVEAAEVAGFAVVDRPRVRLSRAAVLRKRCADA
jgi:hypothetical protein